MDDFTSVPTVDFGRLADPATRADELPNLRDALFRVGFLYLVNTGVEPRIEQLHALLPSVFAIPAAERARVNMRNSPAFLGYTALGAETTAAKTDLREQYDFGLLTKVTKESATADSLSQLSEPQTSSTPLVPQDRPWEALEGPSQYPDVPAFRDAVESYMAALDRVSQQFLGFVAESLSLPPDTFDAFLGNMHRLKLVKYPPSAPGQPGQGVGPHKDSTGLFTFLAQDQVGGLQVLSKGGEWIAAPPVRGSLVVNVQQGFEAITGGVCPATTHRVVSPTGTTTRYSVPFFQAVRLDLTTAELQSSAAHIVARIPVTDDRKKRAVDVPSEFLSPLFSCFGEAQLRNRVISHPDVGRRWYPALYDKFVNQGLSA
ncbi:hypothetical protein SCUCBS95973_003665 [Sporothrix curviconia]|uniref:Fe2OG dioxygenase domain-containing protein n=1 Tax=Sporothrix curviconia TaxID=1260050 RepID=A0ABP0BHE4_9PEZI